MRSTEIPESAKFVPRFRLIYTVLLAGAQLRPSKLCLLDGRRYAIRTGQDVAIRPEATILNLGHDTQSPDFSDKGGEVVIGDRA